MELQKVKLIGPVSEDSASEREPELTIEEAELAAQEAGLSVIRIKRLKASSKVGKFIEQLGAQKIGRTTLVIAQEYIETGIQQCDDLLAKANPDDAGMDLLVEVVKIKQGFTDQLIKTGVAQMKTEEKAAAVAAQAKTLNVPFPAGSQLAIKTADETASS